MRTTLLLIAALLISVAQPRRLTSASTPLSDPSVTTQSAAACSAPEYHQFDFWVGDWDAFEGAGAAPVARLHVTRILDGCALLEDYLDTGGHHGESFSMYDGYRKLWHQTWVANRGELLVMDGAFTAGAMTLGGADPSKGPRGMVRGTWTPVASGVREVAATSADGGATWQPWFDITFRPHKQ
jgi:hypothetical protein